MIVSAILLLLSRAVCASQLISVFQHTFGTAISVGECLGATAPLASRTKQRADCHRRLQHRWRRIVSRARQRCCFGLLVFSPDIIFLIAFAIILFAALGEAGASQVAVCSASACDPHSFTCGLFSRPTHHVKIWLGAMLSATSCMVQSEAAL
jgi:hypothetical protein